VTTADWVLAIFTALTLALVVLRVAFPGRYARWVDLECDWLQRIGLHSETSAERSRRFEKSRGFLILMMLALLAASGLWALQSLLRETREVTVGIAPEKTRFSGEGDLDASVPLRSVLPIPLVDVTINDKGPFAFIIDTGAPLTVLSDDLAGSLGLPRASGRLPLGAGTSPLWFVEALELGDVSFERFGVASDASTDTRLLTMEELSERLGQKVRGILGFPMFSSCVVTLDFPDAELRIRASVAPGGLEEGERHTASWSDPQRPIVPVGVVGEGVRDLRLLVDTGFDGSILLEATAPKVSVTEGPERRHVKRTFYGQRIYRVAELAVPLSIAGHVFEGVPAGFSENDPMEPRDGFLGMVILKDFSLSLDARRRLFRLTR
jgi:predicted aspartyl protease